MEQKYLFASDDGKPSDGKEVIVPILKQVGKQCYLVGTGFFIATNGLLVTAKHVVEDVFKNGKNVAAMAICQFHGENKYILRPFHSFIPSQHSDIVITILHDCTHNSTDLPMKNKIMPLTSKIITPSEAIVTAAYPESESKNVDKQQHLRFNLNFYNGKITAYYANGRDCVLLPFPCYEGTINLLGGASGGPVVDENNKVFAINTTGFSGENLSHYTPVKEILNLTLDINLPGKEKPQKLSIQDLVNEGHIHCE